MTTPAKNAKDMSPDEYREARQAIKSGKAPGGPDGVKTTGAPWGIVASHVRAMSVSDIAAFKNAYGITITIDPPKDR